MEVSFYLALMTFFLFLIFKLFIRKGIIPRNLPPSPPSLPIIGHLHLLKRPTHLTLHNLSKKYGPVLFLRFGSRPVLVISSPSAIEECFTKNDIAFANRPVFASRKAAEYDFTTLSLCPYGQHWRNLRRLTATEIFSSARIQRSSSIRSEEIHFLLKQLLKSSSREVEIESFFCVLTFNIMMKLVAGQRCFDDDFNSDNTRDMINDLRKMFNPTVNVFWSDHIPILRWLTFHRAERMIRKTHKKKDDFLQALVDKRQRVSSSPSVTDAKGKQPLIDVMLSLQESEPDWYTDEIIKGMVMAMLIAGTETSSTAIEWAMSLLLNHPEALHKAWTEIGAQVGQDKILDETDLPKLNYLQSIISETFRLFPPIPLLLPHESSEDCIVCGYSVPRGTMLLVNSWAIQRDPKVWVDATRFMPERFEDGEGEGYKLLPFGVGRRACPGAALGRKMVGLVLGALIQSFEWSRIGQEVIDMREGTGLTMPKAETLVALCNPHPGMIDVLSTLHLQFIEPFMNFQGNIALSCTFDLIGTRKVLIVSSASAVEECSTKNDIIFANRPQLLAGKHLDYNYSTMGLAPYGDYWRNLRRVTTLELFSTSRLPMFASIRQEEVQLLLKELFLASSRKSAKVEVTSKLIELVFNIMLRTIAGKRYYGKDVDGPSQCLREFVLLWQELTNEILFIFEQPLAKAAKVVKYNQTPLPILLNRDPLVATITTTNTPIYMQLTKQ
ncbi:hypothetical protein PTKIN_Ptkin09bG0143400 [Pterospermum kingtungense]